MKQDTTFKDTDSKLDYCSKIIKSRYFARQPLEGFDVIVMGIGRVFTTRSGTKRGEIYVMVEEERNKQKKSALRAVVFQGKETEMIPDIQTECFYPKVKLGKFKTGDFIADDRTRFVSPVKVNVPMLKLLDELKVRRCTVSTSIDNIVCKEKTSTGTYPDRTDWRIIRGIITDYRKGQTKDGYEWGVYTIFDDSLEEEYVSPDGSRTVKPAFTVWVNPLWVVYEKGNEIDFVGTIDVSSGSPSNPKPKPWQIQMTASLLLPVRTSFGEIDEESQ